jgi:hypothetical protein
MDVLYSYKDGKVTQQEMDGYLNYMSKDMAIPFEFKDKYRKLVFQEVMPVKVRDENQLELKLKGVNENE